MIRWGSKISSGKLNYDISCYLNAVCLVVLILAKSPFKTPDHTHEAHSKNQIRVVFLVYCINNNSQNNYFMFTHYIDSFSSFKKAKLL